MLCISVSGIQQIPQAYIQKVLQVEPSHLNGYFTADMKFSVRYTISVFADDTKLYSGI